MSVKRKNIFGEFIDKTPRPQMEKIELRTPVLKNSMGFRITAALASFGPDKLGEAQAVEKIFKENFSNKITLETFGFGHILSMEIPYYINLVKNKRRKR